MTLKIQTQELTVSQQEEAARLAEKRKANAEGEFLILSEDKKRLKADAEKIEESIKVSKDTIDKKNEEINKLNKDILDLQGNLRIENQNFEEFVKTKNDAKLLIEADIAKKKKEKQVISDLIISLSSKHDTEKFQQSQEIKELEATKRTLTSEIETLENKAKEITAETIFAQENIEKLNKQIDILKENKSSLERSVISLENTIEELKGTIGNLKVIIGQLEEKNKDKEFESNAWDIKIMKKTEEYKEVESQAFSILAKSDALNQKEAFIKSQYERAGIEWVQ